MSLGSHILPILSQSSALNNADFNEQFALLLRILAANTQWGIQLLDENGLQVDDVNKVSALRLLNPELDWGCWVARGLYCVKDWSIVLGVYVVYVCVLVGVGFGAQKLWIWRKERKLQERQEVFELVEQVLSLLVAQQQVSMSRFSSFA